jgi:hypothetical protein
VSRKPLGNSIVPRGNRQVLNSASELTDFST